MIDCGAIDSTQLETSEVKLYQLYQSYLRGQRGLSENTIRIYLTDLNSFVIYASEKGISFPKMDRSILRGYVTWLATQTRNGQGYSRVSISRKLSALRAFYRFLVQQGLFKANPMPSGRSFRIKMEKALPSFLSHSEVARLIDSPELSDVYGYRDRAILEVLYACGARLSEVAGIDQADVKLNDREILVKGKGAKERWVIFGEPTEQALSEYLHWSRPLLNHGDSSALFLNRYGKRLSQRSIQKLVEKYATKSGIKSGVHPHTLRHTFASHMLEGNADLRVIQLLLGHSSPSTTQVYTHITKQEAKNAYLANHPRSSE
ncbi:MAG: recombinase XerC [Dehalococcoidia bacterium]|nr:recombinase XerC [Dehalococcoidia bacterium]|tara:strand:+ start:15207 stop:16160 length:954 start_codon:yes stop_codon:yes gene_type:complete